MRYDQSNLSSVSNLGNIGGGLKFVSTISNDGQWLAANSCGCYSERGSGPVWHLPTLSQISSPLSFPIGGIDFSPDSSQLVRQWQMFGYQESALYTSSDLSSPTSIYNRSETAPIRQEWSPDGTMIAFTLVEIDPLEMSATECMVISLARMETSSCWWKAAARNSWPGVTDSSRILYTQEVGGVRNVSVYDRVSKRKPASLHHRRVFRRRQGSAGFPLRT